MRGMSESITKFQSALWAMRVRHGVRKARINRIRDHRRNSARAKHASKDRPDFCHALVDKDGKAYMYMMMTHDEAKEKSKTASLIGLRWTLCEAPAGERIKTK